MNQTAKYSGKFTQNYPTERKDYPTLLAGDAGHGNVSFEQEYETRMKLLPLKRVAAETDAENDEPFLEPGFDGIPRAA